MYVNLWREGLDLLTCNWRKGRKEMKRKKNSLITISPLDHHLIVESHNFKIMTLLFIELLFIEWCLNMSKIKLLWFLLLFTCF
ncbi:hypothetical protein ACJX0J_040446, partial [Zea mays]